MKGLFIPEITSEMFRNGSLESVEALMAEGEIYDIDYSPWIPVSERLPETDTDVLVTNGIGMYLGWIDATDKGWRVDSESEYFANDIVAWMPLPEPYKAESEEQ